MQDSGKVIIYILIGLPVEVLSESCVGNAGGVVAEQVHSWVDDAHRYHLPAARQNYIVVQKTKNKCSFKCNFVECAQMRSILRDVAWSVCLCVCLLVTTVAFVITIIILSSITSSSISILRSRYDTIRHSRSRCRLECGLAGAQRTID